jgi:outer membrane protein insertion porin family
MDGTTPLKVASIRVEGAPNTRRSFLTSLVEPFIPTQSDPVTLHSVLESTRQISQRLYEADIFQSVEAKIEKCRDTLASNGDVDLVFKTREKGRLFLKTSTEVGNGEGNAVSSSFSSFNIV